MENHDLRGLTIYSWFSNPSLTPLPFLESIAPCLAHYSPLSSSIVPLPLCMMETYFWQWAPETQFLPCRYPAASFILHPSVPLLLPVYLPACIFYPSPCATSCVLSNLCPRDWLFWGQGIVQSVVPSPFLSLKTTVTTLIFCSIFILGNFLDPLLGMSPNAVCSVNCSHLTLPSPLPLLVTHVPVWPSVLSLCLLSCFLPLHSVRQGQCLQISYNDVVSIRC